MRTTVTIDDDIALQLEQRRADRGQSFKEVVNDTLRAGLEAAADRGRATRSEEHPTPLKTLSLGQAYLNFDNVAEVLATLEGEDYK